MQNDGSSLDYYPLMQKYQSTTKNLFCNFCKLVGHDEKMSHTDLMRECTTDAYRFQGEEGLEGGVPQYNTLRGYNQGGRGGFKGWGRGGFRQRKRTNYML
jgi:hypothetical protein